MKSLLDRPSVGRALVLGALFVPLGLTAQSMSDDAVPNLSSDDGVLQLKPFEVEANKDVGYMGLSAASGSRLNTRLRDTPASVSVFTSEFIQDIGATSIEDISAYAVNTDSDVGFVSALPNGNNLISPSSSITSRGLPTSGGSSSGRTVNFFSYAFEVDTYNTDRVEFSRGPNSILFGIGQAGGNFNAQSRTADVTQQIYGATLRAGSNNLKRVTIDANVPLIPDVLALRIDAVTDHKNGWRPWEHYDNDRLYAALRFQPRLGTTIDIQTENARYDFLRPRPYLGPDNLSVWLDAGSPTTANKLTSNQPNGDGIRRITPQPWWVYINGEDPASLHNFSGMGRTSNFTNTASRVPMLQDFSLVPRDAVLGGPGLGNDAEFENHTIIARHEVSSDLHLEFVATHQEYVSDQRDINGPDLAIYFDPNERLHNQPAGGSPIANPYVGQAYVENYMQRRDQRDLREALRFTAAYNLDLGDIFGEHQLALMGEHWEQKAWNTTFVEVLMDNPVVANTPEHANNFLQRRTYVDLDGPSSAIGQADYRDTSLPGVGFVPKNAPSYNRYYLNAWMLATQSKFWEDRFIVTLGYRRDELQSKLSTSHRSDQTVGGFTRGVLEAGPSTTAELAGDTLSQGAIFHVNKWFSVLANHSTNFSIPTINQKTLPRDPVVPPEGETTDFGVHFDLLEGRLAARIVYYSTEVMNNSNFVGRGNIQNRINAIWNAIAADGQITLDQRDAELVDNNAYNFDNTSEGWEIELVANPLPNWRIMTNFATNETSWTNVGTAIVSYIDEHHQQWESANLDAVNNQLEPLDDFIEQRYIDLEGTLLALSPEWSANLRTNYNFTDGALRGVFAGIGLRARAGTVLGYTSSDPDTREAIRSSSTLVTDANLGYRPAKNPDSRVRWSVQLNVRNLFDQDDLIPQTANENGETLSYRFQSPREWFVTTSFDF